ncbi:MAG: YdeI/OmpD-associated family protein [Bacteroidia bacterium]|jgi:uncharacterized protein YdeI (YjbR/CyaY-like superfamily)|nr:YdeI/OmpD-associated family protein [Bacteroidia bacterium]
MAIEKEYLGTKVVAAKSADQWRKWLAKHHQTETSIWLVIFKKKSNIPSVYYPEAVDEALCFGWVDSKPNKRDATSYYQFFSKRNPKSNWSLVNKNKVERLQSSGKMAPAGIAMVELAKQLGTWDALNKVDALEVPEDLSVALKQIPNALNYWNQFPPSTRRGILEWINTAKKPETRSKRINETAELAGQNKRANQFVRK